MQRKKSTLHRVYRISIPRYTTRSNNSDIRTARLGTRQLLRCGGILLYESISRFPGGYPVRYPGTCLGQSFSRRVDLELQSDSRARVCYCIPIWSRWCISRWRGRGRGIARIKHCTEETETESGKERWIPMQLRRHTRYSLRILHQYREF